MKIQIGIFVLFVACSLVKSECVERLTAITIDFYAYDAEITEDYDDAGTDNVVDEGSDRVGEVSKDGDDVNTTVVGNHQACILNCYLTTRKPLPKKELCNQKQLKDNCKTIHKKCRCFKLEYAGTSLEICDLPDSSGSNIVQSNYVFSGLVIVILSVLNKLTKLL